ncbi:MAG: hypothetical protein RID09_24420 [Coleofasciculus sp. G1-WW12-02]|uniref:hypothetical protein n=1 Tax=Coleofasciculus sp. G1-WW12-02 TaxID=3068483 RepID=UPI0032F3CF3B
MSNNVDLKNSLFKVIQEEIENALDAYPEKFCQLLFDYPNLRQDLLFYVLCKLSNDPQVQAVQSNQHHPQKQTLAYYSLEMRLKLESYIQEGMSCHLSDHAIGSIN